MATDKVMPVLDEQVSDVEKRRAELLREVKPTFSNEFVFMLTEKTSDALYARLNMWGDVETIKLLDHLVALLTFPERVNGGTVQAFVDNDLAAVVGELSYLVKWEDVG